MKRIFQLTIILFVSFLISASLSGNLGAMSWPTEDAVLFRNFGSNDNGRPVLGMIFNGGTGVLAAEKGVVIFSRNNSDKADRLPSPLGAWTAVDHEDGLISIYSRYEDNPVVYKQVEKSQPIAESGVSGWSGQNGFYFMVFDRRERHWINPAMIVTPIQRTRPPQIISVDFKDAQGVVAQSRNLSQGRYTVLVNAISLPLTPLAQGSFLVPQKIVCSVNGAEAGSLNFEAFSARDGVLMVYRNGLVSAKKVYSAFPAFEAAEIFLTRGQANLEIIVQDIAGNTNTVVTRLIVN
jgi:hypothetical protein